MQVDRGKRVCESAMLADSTRYPLINGNLGVFRFWVARTYIIPITARVEDPWQLHSE